MFSDFCYCFLESYILDVAEKNFFGYKNGSCRLVAVDIILLELLRYIKSSLCTNDHICNGERQHECRVEVIFNDFVSKQNYKFDNNEHI